MAAESRESQRDRLLEAALVHIPFDGWSRRSLLAGAADIGMDAALARRLFPRGGDGLLAHMESWADRKMLERIDPAALPAMRTRERIATLVRARLDVLAPHREAVRRAMAARLLPSNAIACGTDLWRTVDLMWQTAGDRDGGSSHYTKRSLLAAVWSSTLLFWLEDHSEGFADSWAFLERRIDDVMRVGQLPGRLEAVIQGLGRLSPFFART